MKPPSHESWSRWLNLLAWIALILFVSLTTLGAVLTFIRPEIR